jgi:thioredoxin 1
LENKVQIGTLNFHDIVIDIRAPVVVDFWAPWCVWCKKLAPAFASVASTLEGVRFVTVNVEDEGKLAQDYGISSLPTLKFFFGGREVGELIGSLPKDKLEAKVREIVAKDESCLATSSPLKRS